MRKKRAWLLLAALTVLLVIRAVVNGQNVHTVSKMQRENITEILAQDSFSEKDYRTLLLQTGLGKTAVEDLKRQSESFTEDMLEFQEQYFAPVYCQSDVMFPTAREERLVDENGNPRTIRLAPVHDGDIVITRATHTMTWRHGHAAIITDAQAEQTLESVVFGEKSSFQMLEKWRGYPSVLVLRPKNRSAGEEAAQFAKTHLGDVDYSLFVGLKKKDKQEETAIDSTQCAHLVWQAYRAAGIDTDANGGWLVLPRDIANSPELELVQTFGFAVQNPYW